MLRGEEDQSGCSCHAFGLDFREVFVSGDHHTIHVGDCSSCRNQHRRRVNVVHIKKISEISECHIYCMDSVAFHMVHPKIFDILFRLAPIGVMGALLHLDVASSDMSFTCKGLISKCWYFYFYHHWAPDGIFQK